MIMKKNKRFIALLLSLLLFSLPLDIFAENMDFFSNESTQTENYIEQTEAEELQPDEEKEIITEEELEIYPEDELIHELPKEEEILPLFLYNQLQFLEGWQSGLVGNLNLNLNNVEVIDNSTVKMSSGVNQDNEFEANGRISDNEQSFLFHYKELHKNLDFRISTTVTVDSIPDTSVSNHGQIAFGIIVKDDLINNTSGSDYIGVGHLNIDNSNLGMRTVYKTGASENPSTQANKISTAQFKGERPIENEIYELSLQKLGHNYTVTIQQPNLGIHPVTQTLEISDLFTRKNVTSDDNIYVGLFTARSVIVTYSNIEFEILENDNSDLINLEILKLPNKVNYYLGEDKEIDLTGLEVKAQFLNDSEILCSSGDLTVTGYNLNQAGVQTVFVYYGDERNIYDIFKITVYGDGDWEFSKIGNLANPGRHHVVHKDGNKAGYINGSITMTSGEGGAQGRFGNNEESFIFYHLNLPKDSNFEISTTAIIESMPADSNPNQVAFGILVKDDISNNSNGGANSGTLTNQSNFMAVGLSNGYMSAFYKTGSSENPNINTDNSNRNINYNTRPDIINTLGEPIVGFEYQLTLQKHGDVYKLIISQEYFDDIYTQIIDVDAVKFINDDMHVGFFTARNIAVTYFNMNFTLVDNVEEINVQTLPQRTEYLIGEELELAGLEVKAAFSDSSHKLLGHNDVIVSGYDKDKIGQQILTVYYGDKVDTFMVEVKQITYTDLIIDTYPIKRHYNVGEMLDPAGLVVSAQYQDLNGNTHTEHLSSDRYSLSSLNSSIANTTQTITVTLNEVAMLTASFTVEISNLEFSGLHIIKPIKTQYFVGDGESGVVEVDTRGMMVYAQFDTVSGTSDMVRVDMSEITVSKLNTTTAGEIPVEVTWNNAVSAGRNISYTETIVFTVLDVLPEKLVITKYPKTTYVLGEQLKLDEMVVELKYNNGNKENLILNEDYTINTNEFNYELEGTYYIVVTPSGTGSTVGVASMFFPVVVREKVINLWAERRFGQSTSSWGNIIDFSNGEVGTSEGTIILKADNRNPNSNPPNPGFSAGKITRGHDGITYYYTNLNSEDDNFELSADFKVIEYSRATNANPTTGPTGHDGQESFGIMVRDSISHEASSEVFSSNIAAVGALAASSTERNGFQGFIRTGVDNFNGTQGSYWETKRINSMNAPDMEGNTYRLTLIKNNSGFVMRTSGIGEDGMPFEDEVEFFTQDNILNIQEGNIMYIGFYAARHAIVEVSNIELSVTSVLADPDSVNIAKPPISVRARFTSLEQTGEADYLLKYETNVAGSLTIVGNGIEFNEYVEPGLVEIPTILDIGRNTFSAVFWPDARENLTNYNRIVSNFNVDFHEFGEDEAIFVSSHGVNTNLGTFESPIDIETAIAYVRPGQTIYMLEGNYNFTRGLRIPKGNNGTSGAMKSLRAYPGNQYAVTIDFLKQGNGFTLEGDWWHIYGINITRSVGNSHGVLISGSHNVMELVTSYYNGGTGIQISAANSQVSRDEWPSYNLVLNSTSYGNIDPSENNADGFAAKLTVGPGNIFRGCIAFNNVDDGWDLYAKIESGHIEPVIVEYSLAFNNGTRMNGSRSTADGNGFKMGGEGVEVHHIVRNSIAFNNKNNGFTSNSNPWGRISRAISFVNDGSGINYTTYPTLQDMLSFEIQGFISYNNKADNVQYWHENNNILPATNFLVENLSGSLVSRNKEGIEFTSEDFEGLEIPFIHLANVRQGHDIETQLNILRTGFSDGENDNINWNNIWNNYDKFMEQFEEEEEEEEEENENGGESENGNGEDNESGNGNGEDNESGNGNGSGGNNENGSTNGGNENNKTINTQNTQSSLLQKTNNITMNNQVVNIDYEKISKELLLKINFLEEDLIDDTAVTVIPYTLLDILAELNEDIIIYITTPFAAYEIPVTLSSIVKDIEYLIESSTFNFEDICFNVVIADKKNNIELQNDIKKIISNGEILGSIVDFSIEIFSFDKGEVIGLAQTFTKPVIRYITMPAELSVMPQNWGTFRFNFDENELEFVPHHVVVSEDTINIKIDSYSNSYYLVAENNVIFNDIAGHWSKDYVALAGVKGIASGVGNGAFSPKSYISRAEFTQMLVNLLGRGKSTTNETSYLDVSDAEWYFSSMTKAKELGLIPFAVDNMVMPEKFITREEMAGMTAAALRINGIEEDELNISIYSFSDINEISRQYMDDVRLINEHNIMIGIHSRLFSPKGQVTRAQAAVVATRLAKVIGVL